MHTGRQASWPLLEDGKVDHVARVKRRCGIMADIVLTTLNAKYIHSAFGLRYLQANLAELQPQSRLFEFDINQRPVEVAEAILAESPRILGIGVYVWNVALVTELVRLVKRIRPQLTVIVGGPEVSYAPDVPGWVHDVDYVIAGEADLSFAELCRKILLGQPPPDPWVAAAAPDLSHLVLPYALYTDQDLRHRIVYVETSRGCPFACEFCLSALDPSVRHFPLDAVLAQIQRLWERGCRHFKFVDRSFNINRSHYQRVLEFFLGCMSVDALLHFEIIPDRLTPEQIRLAQRFPPGTLQFEVGIQTFNPLVAERIQRQQDYDRLAANLRTLREQTGVHVHADLIAGLPGESLESLAAGFDRLVFLDPHEIQLGVLKRLRGCPIQRHDLEGQMVYNPNPPYEILQNRWIDFLTMQRIKRFARYWDILVNSGRFRESSRCLWQNQHSPFGSFLRLSDWLFQRLGRQHGIALNKMVELLFGYLTQEMGQSPAEAARLLVEDLQRTGRTDLPPCLKEFFADEPMPHPTNTIAGPKRQRRHHGT
jgi:radical SAM superfamily enzyme YgiQ (UPF0313 family)